MNNRFNRCAIATGAALLCCAAPAWAMDWSDNALSYRYGTRFAEPFNPGHIKKHIVGFTHASGYRYGSNYLHLDLLKSDRSDARSLGSSSGAREAYLLYRHTFDLGALGGTEIRFGKVKGVGLTAGFDVNHKDDVGYNSRKRMLVAGPTLMWDVPGFLNTSILWLRESNAPSGPFAPIANVRGRHTYDTHPMFGASWGIPLADGWSFEGYLNFIAAKGLDETGAATSAETNLDMALMLDIGPRLGQPKKKIRVGIGYQFWNNKFGNARATTGAAGQRASTPMVRADFHF
jgi:nucleoside-specific outer membrane channel protein Tsx